MQLKVTFTPAIHDRWCAEASVDEVYGSSRWVTTWAPEDSGTFISFRGEGPDGTVIYPALLVPLDALVGGAGRCDLRTAYDFGGPFVVHGDAGRAQAAFAGALVEATADLGVVTEFARLHPFRVPVWPPDARFHADQHVVDLAPGRDAVLAAMHPTFRRNARKAVAAGLTADLGRADPSGIAAFCDLYAKTMEKVGAAPSFSFRPETLAATLLLPEASLVTVRAGDHVRAAAIVLRSADDLFYFLGASDPDALAERPNNLLFLAMVEHGLAVGARRIHLGAGSESLRRFKAQIGNTTTPYALVRRVHDPSAFSALVRDNGIDPSPAFPPWRDRLRSCSIGWSR